MEYTRASCWEDRGTGGQGCNLGAASYLVGTVLFPLVFIQALPLLVPGGPILAALVFPLDTAHWLTTVLVAWEAGALAVTGLGAEGDGRNAISGLLVNIGCNQLYVSPFD